VHLLADARRDPLLGKCPPVFPALLTHLQTVLRLPAGATALASSAHDPHQIIRYGAHAMSTQFHPEFTAELSAACISRQRDVLIAEGYDPDALLRDLQDSPVTATLLQDFVAAAARRQRQE
jgi:GMP synthase (glutamine-hydrolysing)